MDSAPTPFRPWLGVGARMVAVLGVLLALFVAVRIYEEWRGAREYILDGARSAGLLEGRARKVWVRAARDSMRTDGVVTFLVPQCTVEELADVARRDMKPARTALEAADRAQIERIAREFGLPAKLHPFDGGALDAFVRQVTFPGWHDYALLSRERQRVWFFRAVQDGD